jgi:hypothetical protein
MIPLEADDPWANPLKEWYDTLLKTPVTISKIWMDEKTYNDLKAWADEK